MQAYKNDPALRESFITEMRWHQEQDRVASGTYGKRDDPDFTGCGVGCALHSLFRMGTDVRSTGDHSLLEKHLDWPTPLNHLYDGIFESLIGKEQKEFPLRFATAIKAGADLSMVVPQFVYWMLQATTQPKDEPAAFTAYWQSVVDIYKEWTETRVIPSRDLADLAVRADLAYRADLAVRADRAYRAYRAVRADLAYRAYRAYRADRAYRAYRADLAYRAVRADLAYRAIECANKLIELLEVA